MQYLLAKGWLLKSKIKKSELSGVHLVSNLQSLGESRVVYWLLSLFLALGPVHWLPGISRDFLRTLEWAIFVVALGLVFGAELTRGRLPFPKGLLGPLGFTGFLILWIPGFLQATGPLQVVYFISKVCISALVFWCFFCISRSSDVVATIFRRAFILIWVLACVHLINILVNSFEWGSICGWDYSHGSTDTVGFGETYTGWSIGLAMFIPVSALFALSSHRKWSLPWKVFGLRWLLPWKVFGVIGAVGLLIDQFVSGGRGGILVSILVAAAFVLIPSVRWLALIVVMAGLFVGISYLDTSCYKHARLDRLGSVGSSFGAKKPDLVRPDLVAKTRLDNLSAHRIQGYVHGLEKIQERPFFGHGLKQVMLDTRWGTQTEIHNLWLKWATYTGVLAPLFFLTMVLLILRSGWQILRDRLATTEERGEAAVLALIVLAGLAISMIEINLPLGSFQLTAIWWAAAGSLVGTAKRSYTNRWGEGR